LPLTAAVAVAAVLGALAGSFLPLPIYRLSTDRTGDARPVTLPAARCTHPDLAGTRGWLRLGSTCPRCHQRLGPATATTTLASGAVYAILAVPFLHSPLLPALLVSGLLAVAAAFVDIRCHRLPNTIVLPAAAASATTIIAAGLIQSDQHRMVRAFISCLSVGVALLILAIGTQAIGMGDIKPRPGSPCSPGGRTYRGPHRRRWPIPTPGNSRVRPAHRRPSRPSIKPSVRPGHPARRAHRPPAVPGRIVSRPSTEAADRRGHGPATEGLDIDKVPDPKPCYTRPPLAHPQHRQPSSDHGPSTTSTWTSIR